jgi:hypothetical protein
MTTRAWALAAFVAGCPSAVPDTREEAPQPVVAPAPALAPAAASRSAPAPAPAAEPEDDTEPEPQRSDLAELAEDMAIIVRDFDLLVNDAQCSAWADWASLPSMAEDGHDVVRTGDALHVITESGVETWTAEVDDDSATATRTVESESPRGRFLLVSRSVAPSAKARIEPKRLTKPGRDARKLAAWVQTRVKLDVRAVGQLQGKFGDGVDRIVLFEPKQWVDPGDEDGLVPLRSELAVLVAAGVPKGWLPFGAEESVSGLQVLGVVDIDGDDVQEILWLSQSIGGDPLWTGIELSYFDGAHGFAVRPLGGCSYNGCDAFLPRAECRGVMKPKLR